MNQPMVRTHENAPLRVAYSDANNEREGIYESDWERGLLVVPEFYTLEECRDLTALFEDAEHDVNEENASVEQTQAMGEFFGRVEDLLHREAGREEKLGSFIYRTKQSGDRTHTDSPLFTDYIAFVPLINITNTHARLYFNRGNVDDAFRELHSRGYSNIRRPCPVLGHYVRGEADLFVPYLGAGYLALFRPEVIHGSTVASDKHRPTAIGLFQRK